MSTVNVQWHCFGIYKTFHILLHNSQLSSSKELSIAGEEHIVHSSSIHISGILVVMAVVYYTVFLQCSDFGWTTRRASGL